MLLEGNGCDVETVVGSGCIRWREQTLDDTGASSEHGRIADSSVSFFATYTGCSFKFWFLLVLFPST